jgi:hypothetical protein
MKRLEQALDDYLHARRSFGYKFREPDSTIMALAGHVSRAMVGGKVPPGTGRKSILNRLETTPETATPKPTARHRAIIWKLSLLN